MNISHGNDTSARMLTGVDKLADTIKATLGPKGRNAAMHQKQNIRDAEYSDRAQPGAHILVTNDGATIARSIVLADPVENMGAELLKEATTKTNELAGDGTTTAAVLTQSLLREAYINLTAGADPVALVRGLKKAGAAAADALRALARPIASPEELSRVASVSCQDPHLGDMIARALDAVGLEGVVTIEESGKLETSLDISEGIVFENGLISPFMATDKSQTMAELRDPYILICDTKFTNPQDLLPALIIAAEDDRPCLIVCDGVEGDALGLIHKNKLEGDLDVVCVTAPLYGEGRRWRLEDLAVQTGGLFISPEHGLSIRDVSREMLGGCAYARITRNQTAITGPKGDPAQVERKVAELRHLVEHSDYAFNRERYKERLAKFVSGVARLNIGGQTETELWERKMRAEDAVNAARAALEAGILPGGGVALLDILPGLSPLAERLEGDEKTGVLAFMRAVKAPARQIADNAGLDGGAVVARLLEQGPGVGYDAERGRYVNMLEAGIADPAKVTMLALSAAVSVAATILTVGAGITGRQQ